MIPEKAIEWSLGLVEWFLSLLPDDSIGWPDASSLGTWLGESMGPMNGVLPVTEMVAIYGIMVNVVIPVTIVYRLSLWTYGKIPVVGS